MKKEIIVRLSKSFEDTTHVEQDVEYWMARDLQVLFEYSSWDNFLNVVERAKIACANSKLLIDSHFREVMKMVNLLGVPESRALADFLPTITIKAKDFVGEITHFNVKKENLQGENRITEEHVKNNQGVRRVLIESNIYPEELPAEADIKKLEKQIKKEGERLIEHPAILPAVESI